MEPWLGATDLAEKDGYFGLYKACVFETTSYKIIGASTPKYETNLICNGNKHIELLKSETDNLNILKELGRIYSQLLILLQHFSLDFHV